MRRRGSLQGMVVASVLPLPVNLASEPGSGEPSAPNNAVRHTGLLCAPPIVMQGMRTLMSFGSLLAPQTGAVLTDLDSRADLIRAPVCLAWKGP